jgi:hypothetical protein
MAQYKVSAGESWASIAGKLYGDQRQFVNIMQANPGMAYPMEGQTIEVPDQVAPNPVISQDFLNQLAAVGQAAGVPLWAGANGSAAGAGGTPVKPTSQQTPANSTSSYRPTAADVANAKNDNNPNTVAGAQTANNRPAPTPNPQAGTIYDPNWRNPAGVPQGPSSVPNTPSVAATNPVKPDAFNPFEARFAQAQGMNMGLGNTLPWPVSTYRGPTPPPPPLNGTVAQPVNTRPTRLVPGTVPNVPVQIPAWQRAGFASQADYLRWYVGGPDSRK